MTKCPTEDRQAVLSEVVALQEAGCEIIRVTVNTLEAAEVIPDIKKISRVPIVADIHFDHKLALAAVKNGIDKVRLNPGNIGSDEKISEVVKACKERSIPIRIGVNAGSLEKDIIKKHGGLQTAEGMVESALRHIDILEKNQFFDTIVAMKSSDPLMMIEAFRALASQCDYPFHLGVTEAGNSTQGLIKSAVGIGTLLAEGIGDTIRVSLTDTGIEEVRAGKEILRSLGLRREGVEYISCPTCGRLEGDLIPLLNRVKQATSHIKHPMKIAVMGCVVNGPGESKSADIGVCMSGNSAILYSGGQSLGLVEKEDLESRVLEEIGRFIDRKKDNQQKQPGG